MFAVTVLDQGSKALIQGTVERGERHELLPFLAIENIRNSGAAFGVGGSVSLLLIGVVIAFLVGQLVYVARTAASRGRIWIPSGLLLGGAAGNLIDRIREGAVTDFIDLPAWPTFNIADMAIVAGVLAMLVIAWNDPEPRKD